MIFVNYGTTFGLSWLLGNLPFEKPWYWLLKILKKTCMVMVLVKCANWTNMDNCVSYFDMSRDRMVMRYAILWISICCLFTRVYEPDFMNKPSLVDLLYDQILWYKKWWIYIFYVLYVMYFEIVELNALPSIMKWEEMIDWMIKIIYKTNHVGFGLKMNQVSNYKVYSA